MLRKEYKGVPGGPQKSQKAASSPKDVPRLRERAKGVKPPAGELVVWENGQNLEHSVDLSAKKKPERCPLQKKRGLGTLRSKVTR